MGRERFSLWALAGIVMATSLGACVPSTSKSEKVGKSASAISTAAIPCAARADAVIANTVEIPYTGFYPYKLNSTQIVLSSPAQVLTFNANIVR